MEPGVKAEPEYHPSAKYIDIARQGEQEHARRKREYQAQRQEEDRSSLINVKHEEPAGSIKPEFSDAPMPRPRAPNRRFDPFDGYELDGGKDGVKREEVEFNTRQPPSSNVYPPSAYPHSSASRVKQEEAEESKYRPDPRRREPSRTYSPSVKEEKYNPTYANRPYAGRAHSQVGGSAHSPVKQESGGYAGSSNWQPPASSAFPRAHSDDSHSHYNSQYPKREEPPNRYSRPPESHPQSYPRQPSRTVSPVYLFFSISSMADITEVRNIAPTTGQEGARCV
ncbi:hypothetical protein C8R44DRAFT_795796 [Mycena epipterygia]|nr:hypothetical protein C8R44DRAFT_795796 [Mycena epipterygia]